MQKGTKLLRLTLISALVAVNLFVFILLAYSLNTGKTQKEQQVRTTVQNLALLLDQSVAASAKEINLSLREIADNLEEELRSQGQLTEVDVNALLTVRQSWISKLAEIRVTDDSGTVRYGPGVKPGSKASYQDREFFRTHSANKDSGFIASNLLLGRVSKLYVVVFSRRYNYPDGRFAGVIAAAVPVSYFEQLLSGLDLGSKGIAVLRDAETALIARHPPIATASGQVGSKAFSKELSDIITSGTATATYYSAQTADGVVRTNSYRRLSVMPFHLIVGMAEEDYLAEWHGEVRKTVLLAAIFLIVTSIAAWLLWRLLNQSAKDQAQLRESENYLRAIIASEPECIKIVDAEGRLQQMNPAGLAMIEADSLEQLAGHPVLEVIAPEYRAQFAAMHKRVIDGEPMQQEFEVLGLKGGRRLLETHAVPMVANGQVVHLAVTRDITTRNAYEGELKKAKATAEAANLAKSAFLATMSHEIRTPMNGILGMAQLLLMPDLSEQERLEYARTVHNSGQTLLRLLNDILDLSKVESGKLGVSNAPFSPSQIVEETTALFGEHAHAKGLRIEAAWLGQEGQRYQGDAIRLRQMISNLISNAIKFTPTGYVRIEASEIARNGDDALLEFAVIDSGIGISPDKQKLLFKPFSQVDSSTTREYGGTGLGLSIIRSLADLMGGEVGVKSEDGKGARFWFTIKARVLDAGEDSRQVERFAGKELKVDEEQALSGCVLVVEDNPTNRKVVEALLRKLGITASSLENGQEAVDAITNGMQPDLVLMDVQMPIMDGIKATECIRQLETATGGAHLPIVALTAGAFEDDRQHCIAAGMDDFLTKPVNINELVSVLAKWLGKKEL